MIPIDFHTGLYNEAGGAFCFARLYLLACLSVSLSYAVLSPFLEHNVGIYTARNSDRYGKAYRGSQNWTVRSSLVSCRATGCHWGNRIRVLRSDWPAPLSFLSLLSKRPPMSVIWTDSPIRRSALGLYPYPLHGKCLSVVILKCWIRILIAHL